MNTLRDQRQSEFANSWLESGKFGIILASPRFGKIRTSLNILSRMNPNSIVLIAYPDLRIKSSWEEEFKLMEYNNPNVTFTTHLSLRKYKDNKYDIVIIDEIHLLSEAQIEVCKELFENNLQVLGLTGTLSSWTEKELYNSLKIPVIARYSIEQAIEEGVITDYEITVFKVPLDNIVKQGTGKWKPTEKARFNWISKKIDTLENQGQETKFFRFNRMRIIQNSLAKLNKTKELLKNHSKERVLVFCGITKIADSLGISSYHSKIKEKQIFQDFLDGKTNHLAVVKMGATGLTYKPLNRVIINYFDSNGENLAQKINRCMSFEYDNPEKKALISIISSNESVEIRWLKSALEFFDKEKIKYI